MNNYISSPSKTAEIIKGYKIGLKKSLGQNFLIDTNIAKKIVSTGNVRKNDVVLEIGSGIGNLTEIIAKNTARVICIEKDKLIIKAFKEVMGGIELIEADALKLDYGKIYKKYGINKIISNLSYKIAGPLIMKILIEMPDIEGMIITIQKDIADRMLAKKGSKNYSSFTIKTNFLANITKCFEISRNCFLPEPFVDSVVVEILGRDKNKLAKSINKKFVNYKKEIISFIDFVNGCFLHRRKKLINSLIYADKKYDNKTSFIADLLIKINKDENARAEELDLNDYVFLYRNIVKLN